MVRLGVSSKNLGRGGWLFPVSWQGRAAMRGGDSPLEREEEKADSEKSEACKCRLPRVWDFENGGTGRKIFRVISHFATSLH